MVRLSNGSKDSHNLDEDETDAVREEYSQYRTVCLLLRHCWSNQVLCRRTRASTCTELGFAVLAIKDSCLILRFLIGRFQTENSLPDSFNNVLSWTIYIWTPGSKLFILLYHAQHCRLQWQRQFHWKGLQVIAEPSHRKQQWTCYGALRPSFSMQMSNRKK